MKEQDFESMKLRLLELETLEFRRRRVRRRVWSVATFLVGACTLGWTSLAFSEVGATCEDTETALPSPFHTFCPGSVARALDVNTNFRELLLFADRNASDVATNGSDIATNAAAIELNSETKFEKDGTEKLNLLNVSDASLTGNPALQIGATDSNNLVFDSNEIIARNNGESETLYINLADSGKGGKVHAGGDVSANGKIQGGCSEGMSVLGPWCIDDAMRSSGASGDLKDAAQDCADEGANVCSLDALLLCDFLGAPTGTNSCAEIVDDLSASRYELWTSTSGAWDDQFAIDKMNTYSGDNKVQLAVYTSTVPDGYFCCTPR